LEPEVVMCYYLSDDEIQSYLKCLSSCVKSGHSAAAVNEILRYDTLQLAGLLEFKFATCI